MYVNFNTSENGEIERHTDEWFINYFPDTIVESVNYFIEDNIYAKNGTPIFLFIAPPSPHRPAIPAPQYAELFLDHKAPRTPSYGMHGGDKHWLISQGTHKLYYCWQTLAYIYSIKL